MGLTPGVLKRKAPVDAAAIPVQAPTDTVRRNARDVATAVDRRAHGAGEQLGLQLAARHLIQSEGGLAFGTIKRRIDLCVVELLQFIRVADDAIACIVARAPSQI